jgi:adenylate cyclase
MHGLGGDPMNTQDFKHKLTAILSADVKGYSRLMGEDEVATLKTLSAYFQIMTTLIEKHQGKVLKSIRILIRNPSPL